jgi:hypothetical protein
MADILYVALGDNVKNNKSILIWALQNSGGKKICIIHINQPATVIPLSKLATYTSPRTFIEQKRQLLMF